MNQQRGFTLIETLIYLALFAIVIGGGMVAAYQIIQSTEAGNNHVVMEEEANFLLRKINWAMTGATKFNIVAPTDLEVTKNSTVYDFILCGTDLTIQTGTGKNCNSVPAPTLLNSSNVSVQVLNVHNAPTVGGVTVDLTLTTVQNGKNVTESFSTTKYLRQ